MIQKSQTLQGKKFSERLTQRNSLHFPVYAYVNVIGGFLKILFLIKPEGRCVVAWSCFSFRSVLCDRASYNPTTRKQLQRQCPAQACTAAKYEVTLEPKTIDSCHL